MNIFKNKSAVRLYAFITACLIVLTLLISGINVCASDSVTNYNLLSVYDISTYIMPYDSNDEFEKFGCGTDTDNATWYLKALAKGTWAVTGNIQNVADYPNFFVTSYTGKPVNDQITHIKFFQLPDDAFILFLNRGYYVMIPNITSDYRGLYLEMDNENDVFLDDYINDRRGDTKYFDNVPYQAIYVSNYNSSTEAPIVNGNVPYYYMDVDYLVDVPSSNSAFDEEDNGNNSDDFGSGSSEGNSTNYMYFNDFNISYSVSGLYSGNVVCYGTLNDYQKEHLDEFNLNYAFTFEYKYYFNVVLGKSYEYTKTYSYQQSLSDFYNNGSSKVFTLKDIMQQINTQDIGNGEYGNLYQRIYNDAQLSTDYGGSAIWQKAKMKTTVFIVSADSSASDVVNNSDLHSNSFSKGYNFLDGKSSTYSDGITSNNNPYQSSESGTIENQQQLDNQENGVASSDIPNSQGDNGGSGTSVVTGDNNIVINNNPTFTNNGGSGSGGGYSDTSDSGLMSTFYNTFNPFKTLFNSLNNGNEVLADDTAEDIGSNRFISLIGDTFSFIPNSLLTAVSGFFIASLTILIVAVVIRVLLDLL